MEKAITKKSSIKNFYKSICKTIKAEVDKYETDEYKKSDGPYGNQNCMLCTLAAEDQIRGNDTLPRPVFSPNDIIFKKDFFKNEKKIKFNSPEDLADKISDGERYYLHVNWEGSRGGHEFLVVKIDDEAYVLDAQSGVFTPIDSEEGKKYFEINYDNSFAIRFDNSDLSDALKYNDMKYLLPYNGKRDRDGVNESLLEVYPNNDNIRNIILSLSSDEILKKSNIMQLSKAPNGPSFILPSGNFITVSSKEKYHNSIIAEIVNKITGSSLDGYYKGNDTDKIYDDILDYLIDTLGWVKANSGSSFTENRSYIVIPRKSSNKLTNLQYYAIEEVLENIENENINSDVQIFAGESGIENKYSLRDNTPEDIVKKIRRYYSSGYFVENVLSEVYPNKGESKKDFIARFMKVTKDEYPDIKQRYAVANSYWDRRNKRLEEAKRSELISKSKGSDKYKGSEDNRWTRKSDTTIANTVKDYNKIDMDTFWKEDKLTFGVKVKGKTSDYLVHISFNNIFENLQTLIKSNKNKLTPQVIYKALLNSINSGDVKISCTCPDYSYRLRYFASKNGYNQGKQETRISKQTNPDDSKGSGCKHIMAVLNNLEWLNKIASVINNYVNYMKDNMENNYARFIFPKIYGMTYEKAVQLTVDDFDDKGNLKDKLDSSEDIINLANALGKLRGRFKKKS